MSTHLKQWGEIEVDWLAALDLKLIQNISERSFSFIFSPPAATSRPLAGTIRSTEECFIPAQNYFAAWYACHSIHDTHHWKSCYVGICMQGNASNLSSKNSSFCSLWRSSIKIQLNSFNRPHRSPRLIATTFFSAYTLEQAAKSWAKQDCERYKMLQEHWHILLSTWHDAVRLAGYLNQSFNNLKVI